jgi:uncharacterized protein (UPF0147 family)
MAAFDVIIALLNELSLDAEDLPEGSDAFLEEIQSINNLAELIVFCVTTNQNLKCTMQKLSLIISLLAHPTFTSQIQQAQSMETLNDMLQDLHIPTIVTTIKVILETLSGLEDIRSMANFVLPPETCSAPMILDFLLPGHNRYVLSLILEWYSDFFMI